ncbi:MAG: Gfo/Idh/MocA family oxidoreductase [Lentisphaeria bacterium]|jgi:predicted dehydrogenase|nr:Gfo/Idh/MocA family oxidoreductase [Lentisphaeria bacterium]
MTTLRLGVAGLNRGGALIGQAARCRHARVAVVCDIDRKKADARAAQHGVGTVCYDFDELLRQDIDAVVVATPITLHAEHVVRALAAGKHVLSEVIVATTVEDCHRVAAAVAASGKTYMMAENYCYIRPLTIVENMVKAGLFGEIYYAESDYLKAFQTNPAFPHIGGWRQPTYFGRRGHPYITHSLGPVARIMGERVTRVSCLAAGKSYPEIKADNTCVLLCQTERGHLIRLRASFISPRPDSFTSYLLQGTKGCYQAPQGPGDFHKVHLDGVCKPDEWRNVYEFKEYLPAAWNLFPEGTFADGNDDDCYRLYDSGTALMLDDFALAVLAGGPPPVGVAEAANWTAAGLLSADSVANGGTPVEVPLF